MFHNGQAQARAAGFARTRLIHTIEPLEDWRKMLVRDAWTGILHKEFNVAALFCSAQDNFFPALGVTQGVADEVSEDLLNGISIGHNRYFGHGVNGDMHACGSGILL